tara:strand:- start:298 stop:600 length:303 start_codon:yes stop_codon:yes gene_type:complete
MTTRTIKREFSGGDLTGDISTVVPDGWEHSYDPGSEVYTVRQSGGNAYTKLSRGVIVLELIPIAVHQCLVDVGESTIAGMFAVTIERVDDGYFMWAEVTL